MKEYTNYVKGKGSYEDVRLPVLPQKLLEPLQESKHNFEADNIEENIKLNNITLGKDPSLLQRPKMNLIKVTQPQASG